MFRNIVGLEKFIPLTNVSKIVCRKHHTKAVRLCQKAAAADEAVAVAEQQLHEARAAPAPPVNPYDSDEYGKTCYNL